MVVIHTNNKILLLIQQMQTNSTIWSIKIEKKMEKSVCTADATTSGRRSTDTIFFLLPTGRDRERIIFFC